MIVGGLLVGSNMPPSEVIEWKQWKVEIRAGLCIPLEVVEILTVGAAAVFVVPWYGMKLWLLVI